MASFNKVILMGNLTRDPELRYTPKGTAIARIGLAVNRVWKTETGESKEEVTFVDCDAYGKTGETIGQYLKKGSPVLVEGRLRLHTWEDKNTKQKQSKLRVDVENFKFVGPANRGGEGAPTPSRPAAAAAAPEAPDAEPPPEHDDVPF
ncbi:MAG TPA: single-stranded DNA-binding protein [Candidatus Limnocylindrales bacterium]|nr:single-stranded DNA-binding protein [Candidatus Limnocylindrales bacterium]